MDSLAVVSKQAASNDGGKHFEVLLAICAWCKQVRDHDGEWKDMDLVAPEPDAPVTHSLCPTCARKMAVDPNP